MRRRLYFLFPDRSRAERVGAEVAEAGVPSHRIHLLTGTDLEHSSRTLFGRRIDKGHRRETIAWDGNLGVFFLALALAVVFAATGILWAAAVMAAIMVVTFTAGFLATFLPDVHMDDFREALAHGEILMVVEVNKQRVNEIEALVHKHHPEAVVGGVGFA
jgi:hypothetical protein